MNAQLPTMKPPFSLTISVLVLLTLSLSCKNSPQNKATTLQAEPSPTVEQPNSTKTAEGPKFAVSEVCGLTERFGYHTAYSSLVGRNWTKDGKEDGEWDYGCGFNQDVTMWDDKSALIVSNYNAIGGKDDVKYVTVEYTSTSYSMPVEKELVHRKVYLEFLNKLSKHWYGVELPPTVRKQLLGTKDLNKADTGLQVGTGWINISFNGPAPKRVDIDVHFHESKEAYDKYKDK